MDNGCESRGQEKSTQPLQQLCTLAAGRSECLINPQSIPRGDMAGAGRVRLHRARALRQLLRVEPPVASRACSTFSRLHRKPLVALRIDGATVERACEATGVLRSRPDRDGEALPPSEAYTTACCAASLAAVQSDESGAGLDGAGLKQQERFFLSMHGTLE